MISYAESVRNRRLDEFTKEERDESTLSEEAKRKLFWLQGQREKYVKKGLVGGEAVKAYNEEIESLWKEVKK